MTFNIHKNKGKQGAKEKRRIRDFLKRNRVRICAIFLVLVLCVSAITFFTDDNVAYAAEDNPLLWGHKGDEGVTNVKDGEIYRENSYALYKDSVWGELLLGGVNRVNEKSLPTKRPSLLTGTGLMDEYDNYFSKNVSVVRYTGGKDSKLGISVNSENYGYLEMSVAPKSGRYLYYSISVTSLNGGTGYGGFGVKTGSENGIVVRTEANSRGGVRYEDDIESYLAVEDKTNLVSGYEYGCIDLQALTNAESGDSEFSEEVKMVYLFGSTASKVMLNYLIISNNPPKKIDVANGNVISGSVNGRNYANNDGQTGTATMDLKGLQEFSFENLVVDTEHTPYLYYSFTVRGGKVPVSFSYNGKQEIAQGVAKDVTGCIKVEDFLKLTVPDGKDGRLICLTDEFGKSFTFGSGANIKVNYLFFCSGVDVSKGENVIVKNADAYVNNASFGNYKLDDFYEGDGCISSDKTYEAKGVWAPYAAKIDSALQVSSRWYVNTSSKIEGAVRIDGDGEDVINGVSIDAVLEETNLKVRNPDKQHHGLYFFCLVVAKNENGMYSFPEKFGADYKTDLSKHLYVSTAFCRLDVANNIVYHKVDKDGVEEGVIKEDWLVYGTSSKVTGTFDSKGGFLTYGSFSSVTQSNYELLEYSYEDIESDVIGINLDGWMLFEDTIKNPNGTQALDAYKTEYKNHYKDVKYNGIDYAKVKYTKETKEGDLVKQHGYWYFDMKYSKRIDIDGDNTSILHDATINLYTAWEKPIDSFSKNLAFMVDEYGTTFIAAEKKQAASSGAEVTTWEIVYSTKVSGKNKFVEDLFYVVFSTKINVGDQEGKFQYSYDDGENWKDISTLKNVSTDKPIFNNATLNNAKKWCSGVGFVREEYNNIISASSFDRNELMSALNVTKNSGIKVKFRYIVEISQGSWFSFSGVADCGSIRYEPLQYNNWE